MPEPALEGRLQVAAPAKVNLCLAVGERLPDGYHTLVSLVASVSLEDRVEFEPAPRLEVTSDHPDVPVGEANLAHKAAQVLGQAAGREPRVRIHIAKRIPMAAGLAGGSADAAAVLRGLHRGWRLNWGAGPLTRLGARLGADVPFCLRGGIARMEGVGEQLTELGPLPSLHMVLAAPPGARIATAAAYAALDSSRGQAADLAGARARVEAAVAAWKSGDLPTLGGILFNDLEPAALAAVPELKRLVGTVRRLGALGAVVSGSGPALLALGQDRHHAEKLARALQDAGFWATAVKTRPPHRLD